ncbi:hypothetical protein [Acinetobacter sp. CFCC 10889]|uniref:hypothetical protein n=1 Tax=Acinetobacter sp. CFCC 10889 TaxID=1775557 RepID=UPI000DD0A315|nr:hypothetical protein [Acinetobacter sp. CFCC 10889]
MHITKVLENEVGLQFDRVKDNTGSTGAAPINGVITGSFKRGRTDRQIQVTQSNIKAVLGYDPDNPDYVAVQDALNTGVPYVNVMRIINSNPYIISCDGASIAASLGLQLEPSEYLEYLIKINGTTVLSGSIDIQVQLDGVDIQYTDNTLEFLNVETLDKRVEILSLKQDDRKYLFKPTPQETLNETLLFEDGQDGFYSKVSFCLSGVG